VKVRLIAIDDIDGYKLGDASTNTLRSIRDLLESQNMRVHQGVFPPGQACSQHSHANSEEICYIVKGNGELTVGEKIMKYGPNTLVFIPPGVPHIYRNTGESEMVLIAVYSPPGQIPKK